MNYVDGFVVPVPKSKLADYRRMAKVAGKVWREHGAVEYVECVADDVKPGKHTSFPQSVKLKPGEVVVFSWVVYKSRAQRDRIMKKVMTDPRLLKMMNPYAMHPPRQNKLTNSFLGRGLQIVNHAANRLPSFQHPIFDAGLGYHVSVTRRRSL